MCYNHLFRTNPLNIQNYLTNISMTMTEVKSPWGPMGKVHKGYWRAMGEPMKRKDDHETVKTTMTPDGPVLRIELTNTSVYRTIVSAVQGTAKIIKFLTTNLFHHVKEPIDSSWVGPDIDIRTNSMYALAEEHILDLINHHHSPDEKQSRRRSGLSHGGTAPDTTATKKRKRLFITGHSLGGSMGLSKSRTRASMMS